MDIYTLYIYSVKKNLNGTRLYVYDNQSSITSLDAFNDKKKFAWTLSHPRLDYFYRAAINSHDVIDSDENITVHIGNVYMIDGHFSSVSIYIIVDIKYRPLSSNAICSTFLPN